jgi:threonine/homoserine/homoserine lactone efflux protein
MIALSGALMPGPLLTVTISESTRRGSMTGPLLIAGHGLLELALVAAIFLGLAPLLSQPGVFTVIALSGAAILIWMASDMFRTLPTLSLTAENPSPSRHPLVMTGMIMSLANPYWIVWWVTIGLGYILQSRLYGLWGIAFFFAGHILADFIWYTMVSVTIAKGRRLFTDRIYRVLIGVCAVFLTLFALYFFYAGLQAFMG